MHKIDFSGSLNPEQLEAVTAPDGPMLVLAAAGTGKTRTLVYRVAYLVENGVSPERILLLTFTNKAAREMMERAEHLVGGAVSGIWGGTFHHMANRILRRHARAAGYETDFTILDRDDSRKLVAECIKDRNLDVRGFPRADVLLSLFSAAVNTRRPMQEVIDRKLGEHGEWNGDILRIHEGYEKNKQRLGAMDFDDLLVNCLRLLKENAGLLGRYQEQFLHVLVDEYQDTNIIQVELVDSIAEKNGNVFVVGDDFQSIYGWRGADFRNLVSFPERHAGAGIYKLEANYRSVPEILEVANACIAGNPGQFPKQLRAMREGHRKPVVLKMRDGGEQARHVVENMVAMRREGYKLSQIAVLYRAHFHAMQLQMELARENIPHVVTSGVRFFEQAHIKDVCSILRVLEGPGDEIAFRRLLCMLPGVGERTAAKTWGKLGGAFHAGDAGQVRALASALPRGAVKPWKSIEPILAAYTQEGLHEDGGEVLHRFVAAFYEEYAAAAYEDAQDRLDDIREMVLYTAKFESVQGFLSDVALLTNLDAEEENLGYEAGEAVRLSTVHQAKGLEWPVVIILWATDGMFPSARTIKESENGEAEERRLFYVAVTRARDELRLCVPEVRRGRDGIPVYCRPSRFVEEIPRDLVEEVRAGFI